MNTVEIIYDDEKYRSFAPQKEVIAFLKCVCSEIGLDNREFSVTFTDENRIRLLNREYRNIDSPTDILSFAVEDSTDCEFIVPRKRKINIGDMIICPEILKRNAEDFSVTEENELKRLLIHGVLHLTGENHLTNDSSEPMLIKQERILSKLLAD